MEWLSVYACVCLLGGAVFLTGCGDAPSAAPKVTVLVMRHCIRSTGKTIYDLPGLNFYSNYSGTPWPAWGVPPYFCMPRGVKIVEGTGRWFKKNGNLPMPLQVVYDLGESQRDNDTAQAFLSGFGRDQLRSLVGSSDPFHKSSSCPKYTSEELVEAIEAQMKAIPMQEPEFATLTKDLSSVLEAPGPAARWNATGCVLNKATHFLDGTCSAASAFTERFLMEWGAGLPVAWGRLALDKLPSLLKLHAWYRQIMDGTPKIVARKQASIPRAVLAALKGLPGDKADVTRIFVGHDSELNALNGQLGLTWDADPFPVNATIPGSILRFDRDGDTIKVSFVFPGNYSDEGDAMGNMKSVPATFQGSETSNTLSMHSLESLLEGGSVAACANNWTFDDVQGNRPHTEALSEKSVAV